MKNKCYGCEDRVVGCHSFCDKYKQFREYLDKKNLIEKAERKYESIWNYSNRRKKR